jgi:protein SCO1
VKYIAIPAALLLTCACQMTHALAARPTFSLVDQRGSPVTLRDLRGTWLVVFFGFTHCPDICPTALQNAAGALAALGPGSQPLRVLFITVDPDRDTPAVLKEYLAHFDRRIIGLTGSRGQIVEAARAFGAYSGIAEGVSQDPARVIEHSASFEVYDAAGAFRRRVSGSAGAVQLARYIEREESTSGTGAR